MTDQTQQLKTNHSVRIAILSTGERVLCLFGDVKSDEGKIIGYKILYPFVLQLGEMDETGNLPIRYSRWCPYSPVQEFRLNGEHIISVTFPDNAILENYVRELETFGVPADKLFYDEELENGNNGEPTEAGE
jgi:hypothetical protein